VTGRLRVGTRRSTLARTQTDSVLRRLRRVLPTRTFEAVPIETSGDADRSKGSSPDFTDAIDRALARGDIDLAVHSAKDLPAVLDRRFSLAALPPRADPHDCLVVSGAVSRLPLDRGARVGSSSVRRRAQLLRWRPDLRVIDIRGNVDTRIGLVQRGTVDAAILAVAGIARLHRSSEIACILPVQSFLPAPAQGALALLTRATDTTLTREVHRVDDPPTRTRVTAERAFSAALGGDCRVPLGALATLKGGTLTLTGEVLSPNGRTRLRARRAGRPGEAEALGRDLGASLLARGALGLRCSAAD
jgi:hydroxymethylbilane synthase